MKNRPRAAFLPLTCRSGGFTLIESMVALVVVGMVAAASLALLSGSLNAGARSRVLLEASALAEQRTAAARLLTFADLMTAGEGVEGTFTAPFQRYSWTMSVEQLSVPGLWNIQVVVSQEQPLVWLNTRVFRSAE